MPEPAESLWEKAGWWLLGLIVTLVGLIHGLARRDMARTDSDLAMLRRDFNAHLEDATEELQRLATVEKVAETVQQEMRDMRSEARADRKEMNDKLDRLLERK